MLGVLLAVVLGAAPGTSFGKAWQAARPRIVSVVVPGLPASCQGVTSEGETFLASEPGKTNHLVAVWSAGANNGANTSIGAVSRDGGATWARTAVPGTGPCTNGPGDWIIDQWVSVARGGRAYYESFAGHNTGPTDTQFDAQTIVATSASGGSAWSPARVLDDNLHAVRGVISRTSITADPRNAGRAWAVWARLLNPVFQGIFVARTDDGGRTWQQPVKAVATVETSAASWQIVVRPNGELVLLYGEIDAPGTVQGGILGRDVPALARAVRSKDGGRTWSSPSTVAQLPAYMLARAAAAPDGSIYLVWNETAGSDAKVLVARSRDGATWQAPVTVATFPAGPLGSLFVAPDIAITARGVLGVSYYSGAPGGGRIARWFAHSTNAGATWQSLPLSPPFAFNTGSGGTGDGPQGAYQGLAPIGNGFGALFIVSTGRSANPTDVVFVGVHP